MDNLVTKYLVMFSIAVLVKGELFTKEELTKLKQYEDDCIKESGVDKSTLIRVVQNKEYVDDPKLKEHILCCCKKLKFVNDDGTVNKDQLTEKFVEKFKHKKAVEEAVKTCGIKKDTAVDTAFEMVKCFHKYAPDTLDLMMVLKS
ncbi:hypothetical protein GWI33_014816 [Rhynchophorus ferrugineus]|uniref:Uncharacterized protein n=1 Tax=Rhynchophorus ferrugineus TaxID=354439 RepID=A0A834I3Q4_RHYFE|nr:hypothetical protein GWI33_014816 [Rhynchophorus ferrugineus]